MDKQDRRALKDEARQALAFASYDPKKLVLIHSGATLFLSALLLIADYILNQQIGSTGGLGGIGMRSVISTAQAVLRLAQTVLLPFWQMGYVYLTLKLSRKESVSPYDLTEGFRHLGPVLRLTLLKSAIFVGIGILAANLASSVFFLTPFAGELLDRLAPLMNNTALLEDPAALQNALVAAADEAVMPLMIIYAIVFLAFSIPLFYRYRMASYFLLDDEKPRAISALRGSRKLMRYLCIDLFKLDLSFWWFYLLETLISVLCYGDLILNRIGITLPFSTDVSYFLFFGIYLVSQLLLHWYRKNEVEVTYACTYNTWRNAHDPRPETKPQNQPWEY